MPLRRGVVPIFLAGSLAGCVIDIPHGLWKDAARSDAPRKDALLDQAKDGPTLGEGGLGDQKAGDRSVLEQRPGDKSQAGDGKRPDKSPLVDKKPVDRSQTVDQKPLDKTLIVDQKPVDRSAVDQRTPDLGSCPAACINGCAGGICQLSCSSGCTCPAGRSCQIDCGGGCGVINCSQGTACTINCGNLGCNGAITCGSGMCTVNCGNGGCKGIDCHTSCGCLVSCGLGGCNGSVVCPPACGTCKGPGCTCP